eukprot:5377734-Amphidinium_carterae.6
MIIEKTTDNARSCTNLSARDPARGAYPSSCCSVFAFESVGSSCSSLALVFRQHSGGLLFEAYPRSNAMPDLHVKLPV